MSPSPKDSGYVEVGERIHRFYEKYPDGSLVAHRKPYLEVVGDKTFVVYCAAAYRNPDDRLPGIGYAWEPVPGPTAFTKDSELMNAETSAWGRAIAALGFETRDGIATKEDVQNRTGAAVDSGVQMTTSQRGKIFGLIRDLEKLNQHPPAPHADWKAATEARCHELYEKPMKDLTKGEASQLIEAMTAYITNVIEKPIGESEFKAPTDEGNGEQPTLVPATADEDIPF